MGVPVLSDLTTDPVGKVKMGVPVLSDLTTDPVGKVKMGVPVLSDLTTDPVGKVRMGVPVLSDFQQTQLQELKDEFPDVVTTELGMAKHGVHEIDTGESKPIRSVPYRIAPGWRAELKEEIQLLVRDGILVPSKSPWSFPMVPVRKKETNAIRLCIDCRWLNKVTKADPIKCLWCRSFSTMLPEQRG